TSLIIFARFCDSERNACKTLAHPSYLRCSPDRSSGESRRTLCKRFASVSPGQSGHRPPSLRAPMLGGQPLTDMVSSKQTRSARLYGTVDIGESQLPYLVAPNAAILLWRDYKECRRRAQRASGHRSVRRQQQLLVRQQVASANRLRQLA